MLTRVRQAAGAMTEPTIPRDYRQAGDGGGSTGQNLVELFIDRLVDYRAEVYRVADDGDADDDADDHADDENEDMGVDGSDVTSSVSTVLEREKARTVVVAAGFPQRWQPNGVELVVDGFDTDEGGDVLTTTKLDMIDAVLTTCAVAIAETGTIVLDGRPGQGRRAITLLPDLHIVVVRADQVVARVPDALPLLDPRRAMTWISGPSATSDIELNRVEGVHGPRRLRVVIVD